MTRKRSKLEIYLDILKVIKKGVNKPTRIMYSTNLSWTPLKNILSSMLEQKLIAEERIGNRKVYHITEKGMNGLRYFNKMRDLMIVEPSRTRK